MEVQTKLWEGEGRGGEGRGGDEEVDFTCPFIHVQLKLKSTLFATASRYSGDMEVQTKWKALKCKPHPSWEQPVSRFQKQIWQRIGVLQVLKAINSSVTWSYGHLSFTWMVMTVNAITTFAPTKRGAFSELRHSLHLAVTLVPCTQKSEP